MKSKKRSDGVKIRISGLANGLYDYHFTVAPAELGLDSNFGHPVEIDAAVDKTAGQINLRTSVATAGKFVCDRCAEEFDLNLANKYSVFYIYDASSEGELPPEEVQVLRADAVHIDLTEDIREFVLLSVPLKLLCREGCKGLCPRCGANWNAASCGCTQDAVDSRWQSLEKLLKN